MAHLRRRRRRPDRRRDLRTDRRAVAARADGQLPPLRPGRRGEGAAVRGRRGDPGDVRRPAVREGDEGAAEDRRRGAHRIDRHRRRRGRRRRQGSGRNGDALSGEDEDLGGRRVGVAAREDPRRRIGRRGRPRRPDQGAAGLLAPRPSGGLRDRRHDEPERPSRRRRGRDADGHPRGADDQAAARGRGAASPSSTATSAAWPPCRGAVPSSASTASASPASSGG